MDDQQILREKIKARIQKQWEEYVNAPVKRQCRGSTAEEDKAEAERALFVLPMHSYIQEPVKIGSGPVMSLVFSFLPPAELICSIRRVTRWWYKLAVTMPAPRCINEDSFYHSWLMSKPCTWIDRHLGGKKWCSQVHELHIQDILSHRLIFFADYFPNLKRVRIAFGCYDDYEECSATDDDNKDDDDNANVAPIIDDLVDVLQSSRFQTHNTADNNEHNDVVEGEDEIEDDANDQDENENGDVNDNKDEDDNNPENKDDNKDTIEFVEAAEANRLLSICLRSWSKTLEELTLEHAGYMQDSADFGAYTLCLDDPLPHLETLIVSVSAVQLQFGPNFVWSTIRHLTLEGFQINQPWSNILALPHFYALPPGFPVLESLSIWMHRQLFQVETFVTILAAACKSPYFHRLTLPDPICLHYVPADLMRCMASTVRELHFTELEKSIKTEVLYGLEALTNFALPISLFQIHQSEKQHIPLLLTIFPTVEQVELVTTEREEELFPEQFPQVCFPSKSKLPIVKLSTTEALSLVCNI